MHQNNARIIIITHQLTLIKVKSFFYKTKAQHKATLMEATFYVTAI